MKGIDYNYEAVNLAALVGNTSSTLPEEYVSKNPLAQLPTLEIKREGEDTLYLTQSLPIIEYLDELYPEGSLLGSDALTRYKVREISEIINSGIQPQQNLSVLRMIKQFEATPLPEIFAEETISTDGKGFAKMHILKGLHSIELRLQKNSSEYLVGDSVTMADLCFVPQMYNARRFMIDVDKYFPRCVEVDAKLALLDAFKAAHCDVQPDAKP